MFDFYHKKEIIKKDEIIKKNNEILKDRMCDKKCQNKSGALPDVPEVT